MSSDANGRQGAPTEQAKEREVAIEPAMPIVDAHHHLYDRPGLRYLFDEMLTDVDCGHNVRATVIVQARAMLRADGPTHMQPVGETEFANGVAAMSATGAYGEARICAAIIGYADLRGGQHVRPLLEAHIAAAGGAEKLGGRFRGIRQPAAWDVDSSLLNPAYSTREDMLDSREFRQGFSQLEDLGLSFDAWMFFHQIPRLTSLAKAFPHTRIVLNHCGGMLGIGAYAGRPREVRHQWEANLRDLASCDNVMLKLSGFGQRFWGFSPDKEYASSQSSTLAEKWRPWIEFCVETFGSDRCMFGSNFPVDRSSYSYGVGLNAMKRLFANASDGEKADIFWRTASRFYRLPERLIRRD